MTQLLTLYASIAGGAGLTPGWRTKIPNATWPKFKKKKKIRGKWQGGAKYTETDVRYKDTCMETSHK